MNFQGALTLLKEGKMLRRKPWPLFEYVCVPESGSVVLMPACVRNSRLAISNEGALTAWSPTPEDLFADDWEVYCAEPKFIELAGLTGRIRQYPDGFFEWRDRDPSRYCVMSNLAEALKFAKGLGAENPVRRETDKTSDKGAPCKD